MKLLSTAVNWDLGILICHYIYININHVLLQRLTLQF